MAAIKQNLDTDLLEIDIIHISSYPSNMPMYSFWESISFSPLAVVIFRVLRA
jgi:hypothetical protein